MEKKKSYSELLRSPLWQKKRLEIMQRDNYICQYCGCEGRELQVHHRVYRKDAKPWEYDNSELITLCDQCHEAETDAKNTHYDTFKEICNLAREIGLSEQFIGELFNRILSAIATTSNKSNDYGIHGEEEEILKNILFGTQVLTDAKILFRNGIRLSKDEEAQVKNYCSELHEIYDRIMQGAD